MKLFSARALQLIVALSVSAGFLCLVFRNVDPADFWAAIRQVDVGNLLLAGASCVLVLTIRVSRWWWMLRQTRADVPWNACFAPFLGCLALNNVLPFRAGDIVRVVAFRKRLGVSSSTLLATLAVERLLDAGCLLALLAAFLPRLSRDILPAAAHTALMSLAIIVTAAALGSLIALRPARRLLKRVEHSRWLSDRPFGLRITAYVDGVLASLGHVASLPKLLALIGMTAGVWLMEGAIFFFVSRALDVSTPPIAAWAAMTLASLSTLLPSSPGYVGPYHYFAMVGLAAFGAPKSTAAAFAFLSHAVLYLVITLWGGYLLIAAGGWSQVRLARSAAEPA
jgi:uncharacterized protein (TIRG00374 family)